MDDKCIPRCPFCDARSIGGRRWLCGTTGPDSNGEYDTGTACDKTVFRDGFLRCHDLLVKLVDGSFPMGLHGDGVAIPLALWEDVLRAVQVVSVPILRCPECKTPLQTVRQTGERMYNDDQFDALKAGDYYCETCPGDGRGKSGLKYWWKRELGIST